MPAVVPSGDQNLVGELGRVHAEMVIGSHVEGSQVRFLAHTFRVGRGAWGWSEEKMQSRVLMDPDMGGGERGTCIIEVTVARTLKTQIGDKEDSFLARTEHLGVVGAGIERMSWGRAVLNTRPRGCNCLLNHGAGTAAEGNRTNVTL